MQDKKITKFKTDYAKLKMRVKLLKHKFIALKNECWPIAKAAHKLYERGDKTMYDEDEHGIITPKFDSVSSIMEDLEYWMGINSDLIDMIKNIPA